MTTPDIAPDQPSSSETSNTPKAKKRNTRLLVLIGLLAIAAFALWYDYQVARPAVDRAYEQVAAANLEINRSRQHGRMTNVDVQSTLGRAPSETFVSGLFTVEAYRWNAGMPMKTHDYYAVYSKIGPELAFVAHFKFDLDTDSLTNNEDIADAVPVDVADEGEEPAMGEGGGGGFGESGDGETAGGGRRGFDPEAMFAERDANGDGKLTGEEISDRMRERLETIDTDGDEAVSKEELLAWISQLRSRRGQSGGDEGPGGDEGAARSRRPPLESTDEEPAAETPSSGEPSASPPNEGDVDTPPETTSDATSEASSNR